MIFPIEANAAQGVRFHRLKQMGARFRECLFMFDFVYLLRAAKLIH